MSRFKVILLGSLVAGCLGISGSPALAQYSGRYVDRGDIYRDERNLDADYAQLRRDQHEFSTDLYYGASPWVVERDRQRILDDRGQIRRDEERIQMDRREFAAENYREMWRD